MLQRNRLLLLAVFAVLFLAAIGPIRNYDLFWHLATGRWIVEHGGLPDMDPFAVASDRVPWHNGEWLFQVVAYGLVTLGGLALLSIAKGLLAAFAYAPRRAEPFTVALHALAFAGAMRTFDFRPSGVAALFVAIAMTTRSWIGHAVLAVFWINVHPSALLAPVIALLVTRRVAAAVASGIALLANPHHIHGILAPLELLSFVRSGAFVNAEWLPSAPAQFPLLYVALAVAVLAIATTKEPRDWGRIAVLAILAYLAVRHVRNQGLFFAAFPLVVAPALRVERIRPAIAWAAGALIVVAVAIRADHRLGVAPERFPVAAVARLQAARLPGNIYNPDQFGGYLIWSFPGERRVLTDGRNELYRVYIPELIAARGDQRKWRALLRRYRIDLAVDEYRPPLEVMNAATGARQQVPASLAFWPRHEWALIGYDAAAMVFARRAAFDPRELEKWEIRGVVPDAGAR